MTYSDFSEICHSPFGQSPFILEQNALALKNSKEANITSANLLSPDLFFIKSEKQHDFLEYVAHKQQKIFSAHNSDKKNDDFLKKFFTFFQCFCGKNDLAQTPWQESKNKFTKKSLFAKGVKNDLLDEVMALLKPWRKGPFFFYGRKIESEWQSQRKWERIENVLQGLPKDEATILDLGCNNGYYLFKLLFLKGLSPRCVVGIDPVGRYFFQYLFLLRIFAPLLPHLHSLYFFPIGYEALPIFFASTFSLILCMGIVYHHPNPLEVVKAVFDCLKPGGSAIFEVQGIEMKKKPNDKELSSIDMLATDGTSPNLSTTDLPLALFPKKTYTGKSGFWFLPCLNTLTNWLKRSGFTKVTVINSTPLDLLEQATSKDCPYPSLKEGIKNKQTLEGYPPPYRHLVLATK